MWAALLLLAATAAVGAQTVQFTEVGRDTQLLACTLFCRVRAGRCCFATVSQCRSFPCSTVTPFPCFRRDLTHRHYLRMPAAPHHLPPYALPHWQKVLLRRLPSTLVPLGSRRSSRERVSPPPPHAPPRTPDVSPSPPFSPRLLPHHTPGSAAPHVNGEVLAWGLQHAHDVLTRRSSASRTPIAAPVLTVSGPASTAVYSTVLSTVTYRDSSPEPDVQPRFLQVSARNAAGVAGRTLVVEVEIVPIDDNAPVLTVPSAPVPVFVQGGAAVAVLPAVSISDADHRVFPMTQATVSLPDPTGDQERLRVGDSRGLDVEFLTATFVRIRGSAPASVYEAVLESITYENSEAVPDETTRQVALTVTDSGLRGTAVSRDRLACRGAADVRPWFADAVPPSARRSRPCVCSESTPSRRSSKACRLLTK